MRLLLVFAQWLSKSSCEYAHLQFLFFLGRVGSVLFWIWFCRTKELVILFDGFGWWAVIEQRQFVVTVVWYYTGCLWSDPNIRVISELPKFDWRIAEIELGLTLSEAVCSSRRFLVVTSPRSVLLSWARAKEGKDIGSSSKEWDILVEV